MKSALAGDGRCNKPLPLWSLKSVFPGFIWLCDAKSGLLLGWTHADVSWRAILERPLKCLEDPIDGGVGAKEEATHGVMEGSGSTVCYIPTVSLHVRDMWLEGLSTVARQQSFSFVYIHILLFFYWSLSAHRKIIRKWVSSFDTPPVRLCTGAKLLRY